MSDMKLNIVESWQIDPQAGPDSLEAKQPYVDNGTEMIASEPYFDPKVMEQEWDRLWTRVWLIAAIESDLPEPGDYSVYRLRHESIVVVRQDDGEVKAFYNVCAHRGNRLVHNDRGSVMQFTCSFHSWRYDLEGNFIQEVITGLGMPTSVAIQGDYVSVPDLHGRLVILDKSNTIMAVLGHNSDPKKRANFNVPQSEWIEGVFSGTHGSYWDTDGNLYIQDWNVSGRLMKLVRVK